MVNTKHMELGVILGPENLRHERRWISAVSYGFSQRTRRQSSARPSFCWQVFSTLAGNHEGLEAPGCGHRWLAWSLNGKIAILVSLPRKKLASIAMCTRGYNKLSKCGMDPQPRQILALNEDVEWHSAHIPWVYLVLLGWGCRRNNHGQWLNQWLNQSFPGNPESMA